MSVLEGGRIVCDGLVCGASASLPVALRSFLRPSVAPSDSAMGWLFVTRNDEQSHYCPRCAVRYRLTLPSGNTVNTPLSTETRTTDTGKAP
jgi:hypothetical protein